MRSSSASDAEEPPAGTWQPPAAPWRSRRRFLRQLLWWVLGLAAVGFAVHLLLSNDIEIVAATVAIEHLSVPWLLLAIVAELGSYVAFAGAQRQLLRAGGFTLGLTPMTGVAFASQAVANVLPAGIAFGTVVAFRRLHRRGSSDLLTVWMLVVSSALYVAILAVLALVGTQVAGPSTTIPDLRPYAVGVIVVLVLLGAGAYWLQRRGALARAADAVAAWVERLSRRRGRRPAFRTQEWRERYGAIPVGRAGWLAATVLLTVAWLADIACLLVSFYAVGANVPLRGLLLAYCAGQLASLLPVTPGGLGVVEGSLTLALVAFGGAQTGTLAAVLLYRLVSFWGVTGAGALSYVGLRLTDPPRPRARVEVEADEPAGGTGAR